MQESETFEAVSEDGETFIITCYGLPTKSFKPTSGGVFTETGKIDCRTMDGRHVTPQGDGLYLVMDLRSEDTGILVRRI